MKKRILSLILTACMLLGMLPTAALATDITAALTFTAETEDITGDGYAWTKDTLTLTLSGLSLKVSASAVTYGITLPAGSTLVLTNGTTNTVEVTTTGGNEARGIYANGALTIEGTGALSVTATSNLGYRNAGIRADGALTITGGTITAKGIGVNNTGGGTSQISCGIYTEDTTITLSGGSVTAVGTGCNNANSSQVAGAGYGIYAKGGGFTISGSAVVDATGTGGQNTAKATSSGEGYGILGVTITGGTVTARGIADSGDETAAGISGATITGGTVTATGATASAQGRAYGIERATISGNPTVTATATATAGGIAYGMGRASVAGGEDALSVKSTGATRAYSQTPYFYGANFTAGSMSSTTETTIGTATWGDGTKGIDTTWAGSGTQADPHQISTAAELSGLAWLTAADLSAPERGKFYQLTRDIILNTGDITESSTTAVPWMPITVKKTFDGQGHTVSGIYMNYSNKESVGLFESSDGTTKNLTVTNGYIKANGSNTYAGGIAATNEYGIIDHCANTGVTVVAEGTGNAAAGGITGKNGKTIRNCYNTASVSTAGAAGNQYAGGIAADQYSGSAINCYNTGAVNAAAGSNQRRAGGILGNLSGTVTNCYNTGTISGGVNQAGGIAGYSGYGGKITGCYAVAEPIVGKTASAEYAPENCDTFTPSGDYTLTTGGKLLDKLNAWLDDVGKSTDYYTWKNAAPTFDVPWTAPVSPVENVASVTPSGGSEAGYETFATALAAANASSGSTLKLLADAGTDEISDVTDTFTLDLGGKTLSAVVNIIAGALTITDSAVGGKLVSAEAQKIAIVTQSEGSLTVAGGTVIGGMSLGGNSSSSAILGYGGDITVSGGTVRSETGCAINTAGGQVLISGGAVATGSSNAIISTGELTITSGTVTAKGDFPVVAISGGSFAMSGGTVQNTGTASAVLLAAAATAAHISGGTITGSNATTNSYGVKNYGCPLRLSDAPVITGGTAALHISKTDQCYISASNNSAAYSGAPLSIYLDVGTQTAGTVLVEGLAALGEPAAFTLANPQPGITTKYDATKKHIELVVTVDPPDPGEFRPINGGVTVNGSNIEANGNAITIIEGEDFTKTNIYYTNDPDKEKITLTGFTGDTTDGYNLMSAKIYGGRFNAVTEGDVAITMLGGRIQQLFAGGRAENPNKADSYVTGKATITVTGGGISFSLKADGYPSGDSTKVRSGVELTVGDGAEISGLAVGGVSGVTDFAISPALTDQISLSISPSVASRSVVATGAIPSDLAHLTADGFNLYLDGTDVRVEKLYNVMGEVTESNGTTPVVGAKVKLMQGRTQIGEKQDTNNSGTYLFSDVPEGTYNVVATVGEGADAKTKTLLVTVDSSVYDANLTMPAENISSVLEVTGDNTPAAVVGGLDEIAAAEQMNGADSVTIKLTVESKAENNAPNAAAIKALAGSQTVGEFLDMSLNKIVTGTGAGTTPITNTNGKLLEIVLPYDFSGKKDVTVYRYHGTAQMLTKSGDKADGNFKLDENNGLITIYATKFSTYAVAYSVDTPTPPPVDSGSGISTYAITATAGEGGSISPKGTVYVNRSGSKSFTITPDEGFEIADVLVDGVSVGKVSTYTFEKVTARHTIEAVFQKTVKNPFVDVTEDDWFHDAVTDLYEKGLMTGTAADSFSPLMSTDRATIVTALWRMEGMPSSGESSAFPDVPADAWYAQAVAWGHKTGIVKGYDTGKFGPADPITREQLAAILWRYAGSPAVLDYEGTGRFTDTEAISLWAAKAVTWALSEGILTGKGDGILDPTGHATRAEAAAMLARFLKSGGN